MFTCMPLRPSVLADAWRNRAAIVGYYRQLVRPRPGSARTRELTKLFETVHSLPLAAALAWLKEDSNRQRGEFVLLVEAAPEGADDGAGERVLKLLLAEGLPVKQCAKLASEITGASKNELYQKALALKDAG